MHHKHITAGLVAALATIVLGDSDSDVTQLTQATFNEYMEANPLVLAEFFAPWCGHCKALGPEYEEAATTLKEKDIKLVKIDCTEEADLCKEYGVEGYPTLKVFRGLEIPPKPYSGPRKAGPIASYMVKQSLPAVSKLDVETLEDFKSADKVVVVAYIGADDKASTQIFTELANEHRDDYLFGVVHDAEIAKAEGVESPALVVYKSFDEGKNVYKEKLDAELVLDFIKTCATPLIGEVGPETYAGYMASKKPLFYIFAETIEERTKLSEELKPIAEKHKGVINFATIDASAYGAHASNLNLPTDKFPSVAIQHVENNQKFPYDLESAITHDNILKFVDDFVAGRIEPSIKSEPIPEKQEGPVTVVVAHSYNDIVMDNDKDVLLEFYAPWCGHCKALAPKYEQLAQLYNEIHGDKVVIAKVDATANDVPDDIQGFPTIKLYAAKNKENPITYSGSRSIEDIISFIKENGHYEAAVSYQEPAPEEPAATAVPEKEAEEEAEEKAEEKAEEEAEEEAEEKGHDEL